MAEYKINLTTEDFDKITALSRLRGIDANTVIAQAIATEKLIADNVGRDDDLLIKSGDTFRKFTFENSEE